MIRNYLLKFGLPVGLLIMALGYFSERITNNPNLADFVLGLGFALVLMAFVFKVRERKAN